MVDTRCAEPSLPCWNSLCTLSSGWLPRILVACYNGIMLGCSLSIILVNALMTIWRG